MSIKIENTEVFGWKMAIAGCRNPMNSRDKSDSAFFGGFDFTRDYYFRDINGKRRDWQDWLPPSGEEPPKRDVKKWAEWYKKRKAWEQEPFPKPYHDETVGYRIGDVLIGPNDHKLLMNLCKGGTEESKWRRMVHVQMDVTAPLYWWKEFETYKVGTVSNSCSTMHKIHAKEFTLDDFSCEHLIDHDDIDWPEDFDADHPYNITGIPVVVRGFDDKYHDLYFSPKGILNVQIEMLNKCRNLFLETKDKKYWYQMIQLLPSSYNQKRTIDLNYEVLAAQYRQRKDHKLDEWHQYCDWIKTLPYSEFITMEEKK